MSTATISHHHHHDTDRDLEAPRPSCRPATPATAFDGRPARHTLGAPMVMAPGSFAAHATRRLLHDVSAHRRAR